MGSRILVVDDDPLSRKLVDKALSLNGNEVVTAPDGPHAIARAAREVFDVALVDLRMPGMGGIDVLRTLKQQDPGLDVVLMTAYPELGTAIEALREGADDYLQKPLNLDELHHRLGRVLERRRLRSEVSTLRSCLGQELATKGLVAASPQMLRIRELIEKVAPTDSPVLIEGESGTGKERVAAAIHRESSRAAGPFIPVNCAAIPADLMESEFFGHVRGAFSGAVSDTLGLFRSANGGTLFLDEVGELPLPLQSKLLRVLQEKEVRPVGATKTSAVNVRVVAATNRLIEDAVAAGAFRPDLFYRLNVVRIVVPALRERKDDIPALVTTFLRELNERFGRAVRQVAPDAMSALLAYAFPGNVRELENILERAYALGATREITLADLPALASGAPPVASSETLPTLSEVERELILRALRIHGDNREQAARALGISSRTMYRRLREYGIQ